MQITIALTWILSIATILLMLARPWDIAEVYWVSGGALLLAILRLVSPSRAAHALREGSDVYLFLIGMMVLAELAREQGVFRWVAAIAAHRANGSPLRLFALVYLAGVLTTAFLSNDATAVLLTPAVLAVARTAAVRPRPYLMACALVANAASFVFPISNPANLVVFGASLPSLAPWLRVFLLPSIAAIAMTFLCLLFLSRKDLRGPMGSGLAGAALDGEGKIALAALVGAAAILVAASGLGLPLGATTCAAGFAALILVGTGCPRAIGKTLRGVSWSIVPLVAGLFVIVEALKGAGLLTIGFAGFRWTADASQPAGKLIAGFAAALLANAMNNLPVGLIGASAIHHGNAIAPAAHALLSHAILAGVDLGPNLSVTGSLATILWLIAIRKEQVEITAWEFFRFGAVTMPVALGASLLLVLR